MSKDNILTPFAKISDLDIEKQSFTVQSGIKEHIDTIVVQVINLQEEAIKKGLIALGWTPPPENNKEDESNKAAPMNITA